LTCSPSSQNWFQNRRAKEKLQIKKNREFEAQQAAERAASDDSNASDDQDEGPVSEYYGNSNHSQALQASSASFPSTSATSDGLRLVLPESTDSLEADVLSAVDSVSPSVKSESFIPDEYPSPKSGPFSADTSGLGFTTLPPNFQVVPPQSATGFESHISSPVGSVNETAGHAQIHDFDSPHPGHLHVFGRLDSIPENILAPTPTFPSQLLLAEMAAKEESDSEGVLDHFQCLPADESSAVPTPSDSPDMRFKSPPPPANLASRRNKGVPAQLSTTALRSYSYGPKTGLDMSRADTASPMRRVASATGPLPSRIHKPSVGSAPRSPLYLERTKDALMRSLHGARSPVLGSLNTALSPVTSSECSMPGQEAREQTVSSSASDDEQRYTFGAGPASSFLRLDSTLKTPPGTPGIASGFPEQMISIETPWNYNPPDEQLITPGLGSFGSEEFSMAPSAPGYIIHSQPPTPGFAPNVGSMYFPFTMGGNAASSSEYTFPGESYTAADCSAKSSPGQPKSKLFQFTPNVTPQDYTAER
jgi:hypothetical protein